MKTDLNKLKQYIRPATAEEVRLARMPEVMEPEEPGFVYALESDMRIDFLYCAYRTAREQSVAHPRVAMAI